MSEERLFDTDSHIRPEYLDAKLYRPGSGDEGIWFMEMFCDKCQHDIGFQNEQGAGCELILRSMSYELHEPEYPREWIHGPNGPECTAFLEAHQ